MSTPPLAFRLPAAPADPASRPAIIPAELLFQGSQEILIGHNGETYRLRITRNGKLILTK
ncbi:hemin uptake protein HemP [Thiobacillus sp.]